MADHFELFREKCAAVADEYADGYANADQGEASKVYRARAGRKIAQLIRALNLSPASTRIRDLEAVLEDVKRSLTEYNGTDLSRADDPSVDVSIEIDIITKILG